MKKEHKIITQILFLLFYLFVWLPSSFSQKQEDDFIIEKINGVKYYIHSVEKGNTLFSIAKKYEIGIDELKKNNPEAANGLRIGQTLKIPVSKANPKNGNNSESVILGNFIIHEVAGKETLYSISKKYNVKVKDIIDINPETASKDLFIGQKLKIPILKSQDVKPKDILPAVKDSLINHIAKKGETIFSIARLYDVNVDSLYSFNPGAKNELKENQLVRIPRMRLDTEAKIPHDTIMKSAIVLKEDYHIALLLPFYVHINDSLEKNLKFNEKQTIFKESEIALLFYEGALLALDSIKKSGGGMHLHVFDTAEDSLALDHLLKEPELKKMDLIIGPFYQYLFKEVALFAKQNQTAVVCPVPQSAKILLENRFASKVFPSPLVQADQLAEYVINTCRDKKILVFGSTEKTDMRLCQSFIQKAGDLIEKQGKNLNALVNDFYFAEINTDKVKALLSATDTNYIVLPSHNQVFVSDMLTKLNSITDKYKFVVFGLDKITEFENIDINYLHKLNVHVACPANLDYENPKVLKFNTIFREKYKTEPGKYGFLGFDVTYYYLSALKKYGKNFYDYLPEYKLSLLTNSFDFIKTGFESGCENKHVFVLKYDNFRMVKMKD